VETGRAFFEAVGSKDKQYKVYPGMRHEPLNELGKEEVQRDISNWISAHL
jgi:lysophospholipase